MDSRKGQVSVTTENIFPIIRQWLYSDQDIFMRELVSNCADAISKYKRLIELGKALVTSSGCTSVKEPYWENAAADLFVAVVQSPDGVADNPSDSAPLSRLGQWSCMCCDRRQPTQRLSLTE